MSSKDLIVQIKQFLKIRFSLHKDKEDEVAIVESIKRGIEFRGINVWILVFAIFLASIGLNVNSTAVIIGAMLISPLMGPIMGVGLGLGIFDFELVKAAAKNLAIMVSVSLIASTLYFLLSPLSTAQSELLARTHPTIWDVLIASFGGLAGIVAGSSREKGTVIPGVAIATALMPPLCTAGFGLANGDFYFFIGAFYLFCINAVFISVSTFVVIRLLKFSKRTFLDKKKELRIKRIITTIVLITIIPSIIIAYFTVQKIVFEQRAAEFIKNEFQFSKTLVLSQRIDYENNRIDLVLIGDIVPDDTIALKKAKVSGYKINEATVQITQGINDTTEVDVDALKSGIVQEVYSHNNKVLDEKDKIILGLQNKLSDYKKHTLPVKNIAGELKTLNENVLSLSIQNGVYYNVVANSTDTITTAYVKFRKKPVASEAKKLEGWLKARTQADTLKLIIE
jgi:uncharacterized hydrophobic protein (TIGR00271 family)